MTVVIPETQSIATPALRRLREQDPDLRVIDVRTGGEFEISHIPGSYNIPLDTLGEHVDDLAAIDHPVVLVCQSGGRASEAHTKLDLAGKQRLHVLEGGMTAWEASGGDVVHGDTDRWAMDRQVRFVAGLFALVGVLASLVIPRAKWVSAGVAGGLVFSAVTNTCAMAQVLGKLPYNRTDSCNIAEVLDELNRKAA